MDSGTLIALGLLAVFSVTDVSPSRDCVKPYILGGLTNIRGRGQRARYVCRRPYRLFGTPLSTCINGHWIPEPPKCGIDCPVTNIKMVNHSKMFVSSSVCLRGYQAVPFITAHCDGELSDKSYPICIAEACAETYTFCNSNDCNVFAARNLNELYVSCEPGFSPTSVNKIVCDSDLSHDPFVGCRDVPVQLSCDFEKASDPYCGWGQPKTESQRDNAFLWFRKWRGSVVDRSFLAIPRDVMPATDHTTEFKDRGGAYLYLPAQYLKMGDGVRLFSPAYDLRSNQSLSHCFTFWYYMKMRSVGELNIYINNELKWTMAGEQGSEWNEGFVPLPNDFVHIVVEATRGFAPNAYIAIDDFAITNSQEAEGHECFAQDVWKIDEPPLSTEKDEMPDSDDDLAGTTLPPVNKSTPHIHFNASVAQRIPSEGITSENSSQDISTTSHSVESLASSSSSLEFSGSTGLQQEFPSSSTHYSPATAEPLAEVPSVPSTPQQMPFSSDTLYKTSPSSIHQVSTTPSNATHEISIAPDRSVETSIFSITSKVSVSPVETQTSQSYRDPILITVKESKSFTSSETIKEASPEKDSSLQTYYPPKPTPTVMQTLWPSAITSASQTVTSSLSWSSSSMTAHEPGDSKSAEMHGTASSTISISEIPSSSPTPVSESVLSPKESLNTNVDNGNEILPDKLFPDTIEGVHFNAHKNDKSNSVTTRVTRTTESAISSGDLPKNSARMRGHEPIRGNRIEDSEDISDTHSNFDDALDPDSEPHYSDSIRVSTPDARSGVKFLVSKPPSEETVHVKFPNDLRNGMDEETNSASDGQCSSTNCIRDESNDHGSEVSENPISEARKNNSSLKEKTHEALKPKVLAEEPEVHSSYVQGSKLSTTKVSSVLHYMIVTATGIALMLMIIGVIWVFRIAKKRRKMRQRSGTHEDDLSINLQLANSKEILNFSLLQPDHL